MKDNYYERRMKEEEKHYEELYKKSFGLKGLILGILTLGIYQIGLGMDELRRVGLY